MRQTVDPAPAAMAPIEAHGMAGQKSVHDAGHRTRPGSDQQVEMIEDKRPSITGRSGLLQDGRKPCDKAVSVINIFKYRSPVNSAADDMVERPRSVYL